MSDQVTGPGAIDQEIVGVFLDESEELLADVDVQLIALESQPDDTEALNAVFRAFHSIKGNSAFFGLMRLKNLAHRLEDVLSLMREGRMCVTTEVMDTLLCGVDELRAMLSRIRDGAIECPVSCEHKHASLIEKLLTLCSAPHVSSLHPDVHASGATAGAVKGQVETWKSVWEDLDTLAAATTTRSDIQETLQRLRTHLQALAQADGQPSNQVLPPQDVVAAPPKSKSDVSSTASATPPKAEAIAATPIEAPPPSSGRQETSAHHHANRTMRVEEKKIDEFLDYVGELIIVREMFANVGKRLRGNTALTHLSSEYQRALEAFTALSHDLQHSIMEVRKISVRTVLQKVPRIIRDLASGNDKEVKVELDGTEVAVDKSLLEGFEAPIMHMVRNAIDHGIETREVRVEAGKPVTGHITVSVHEMPDDVVFTIRDDGRGIDDEALRQKATAAGIIDGTTAAKLSRKESYELLFAPGLSTAKAVTEVSGRGVGMDVVKRNVTELGGRIDIESERGAGTTFSVHLPKTVTVQILDGFLVQVGRERYVLPLRSIHESFRPVRDEIHTVAEQGECIYRHGHIFPLVRVADLLCVKSEIIRPDESIIVSVDVKGGGLVGLMVDHVLGTQQIVLRDVDGIDTRPAPFSGGAVLGDGHVAMVVDVERLGELLA